MGNLLFGAGPETVYSVPAQDLDEYVQTSLRPTEDCQKQIDEAVDSICAALQGATAPPMVTGVARVSGGPSGLGLLVIGSQSDLVLSTYCVPGPGCTRHHPVPPTLGERMGYSLEFRSTDSEVRSAPYSCVTRGRLLNLSVLQSPNL